MEDHDPDMGRPSAITVGAVLVGLRALVGTVVLLGVMRGWDRLLLAIDSADEVLGFATDEAPWLRWLVFSTGAGLMVLQLVLAVLIFRGHNWARVLIMLMAVFDISTTFVAWSARGQEITFSGGIYSLALDILILLSLSSKAAAAYTRRHERT